MIRRILAIAGLAWAFGFLWFAAALPQPQPPSPADAIVVPTGSEGRIARGLELLALGSAPQLLVSGVDPQVRAAEFQLQHSVPEQLMQCCITLGFAALDTRGNALEAARWVEEGGYGSIRLVTADWHMRRAALELGGQLPEGVKITRDAVRSQVSFSMLLGEYHKFLAVWAMQVLG